MQLEQVRREMAALEDVRLRIEQDNQSLREQSMIVSHALPLPPQPTLDSPFLTIRFLSVPSFVDPQPEGGRHSLLGAAARPS